MRRWAIGIMFLVSLAASRARPDVLTQRIEWPARNDRERTDEYKFAPFDLALGTLTDVRLTLNVGWSMTFVYVYSGYCWEGKGFCIGNMCSWMKSESDSLSLYSQDFSFENYVYSPSAPETRSTQSATFGITLDGSALPPSMFAVDDSVAVCVRVDASNTYAWTYPWNNGSYVKLEWPGSVELQYTFAPDAVFEHSLGIEDVSDDQGGALTIAWNKSIYDAPSLADSVAAYQVERLEDNSWVILELIEPTHANSYTIVVATEDVHVIGQPQPFSRYRVNAMMSDPAKSHCTIADSAYSIDNLPPPKPSATMLEDLESRTIIWTRPTIPDFGTACVYRGSAAGFTPGETIACPTTRYFEETDLGWYFYRVQFSDIHGNVSEFSDELHGQWPTPVPGAMPAVLRLYPCQPNPFNPRTTIKYDLPAASPVRLSVFDVSGRLVRTLVDDNMPQGSHEAVWDGRDYSGRDVGSGSYLARLEFGRKVETVRMGLVR